MKDSEQLWEWPDAAFPIAFAVSAPIVLIELVDGIGALIVKDMPPGPRRGFALTAVDLALIPGFAAIAFTLSRRGLRGAYLSVISIILAQLWWLNFRGAYIRLGTFDRFEVPYWPWFRFAVLGLALGIAAGLATKKQSIPVEPRHRAWFWVPGILAASGWSWYLEHTCSPTTMFAPTRWIALMCAAVFIAALLLGAEVSWRIHEKGIYAS